MGTILEHFGNRYLKINLPRATLALVASWLIQKETQESITMRIHWEYFWNTFGILLESFWNILGILWEYFGNILGIRIYFGNKNLKMNLPKATLALVASWLIQKETQESITMRIDGRYV